MPDWGPYPPAPPSNTMIPRFLTPIAGAGQIASAGLGGLDSILGSAGEMVQLPGAPPDPGNLGDFMFGTGNLAEQQVPEMEAPPDRPTARYIDTGMEAVSKALGPDEAARIFNPSGTRLNLPQEFEPEWGGVRSGGPIQNEMLPRGVPLGINNAPEHIRNLVLNGDDGLSTREPLLTAGQMEQDARAHAMIDRRYPDAGTFDPMREQIGAAANLRKLEELLPAAQRETFGANGAFAAEGGVIRNRPALPISQGDTANLALLEQKLGVTARSKLQEQLAAADQVYGLMGKIESEAGAEMNRLRSTPEYARSDEAGKARMEEQFRAKIEGLKNLYMQAYGLTSGNVPSSLYRAQSAIPGLD